MDGNRTRAQRALAGDERGASSVEAVLVFPALVLVFLAIIHGATLLHAGNVAQGAAQSAYEAARLYDATPESGTTAGHEAIAAAGGGLVDATVVVDVSPTTITVTVTGAAPALVPGLPLGVTRTVSGPVERWTG